MARDTPERWRCHCQGLLESGRPSYSPVLGIAQQVSVNSLRICAVARRAIYVQRISHHPHSSKLEHLGLAAALKGLLQESTRQHQIRSETQFRDIPLSLDSEVSLAVLRVAQEVLRNGGKHSRARNIRIELIGEPAGFLLRITGDRATGSFASIPGQVSAAKMDQPEDKRY